MTSCVGEKDKSALVRQNRVLYSIRVKHPGIEFHHINASITKLYNLCKAQPCEILANFRKLRSRRSMELSP